MKILQLIQKPQLRGAEIFATQLSNNLLSSGHEVIIASLFKGEQTPQFSGKHIALSLSGKFRWLDWRGFKALASLMANEKPDIIQANAGDTLKYAVLSKLLFKWKQPIVFRNASMVSLYIRNPIVKELNSYLYSKVDAIASVSKQSKKDLNSLFPATKNKSIVIPIGVETKDGKSEVVEQRHELGLSENEDAIILKDKRFDEIRIVHVGGFSFEKNHKGLLQIFNNFKRNYPNAKLKLVGDGPLRRETEELAKDLNLNDSVEFMGYQTEALKFIRQADVFVLPSLIEGLPGVILEAQFCKVPVVAYDVGGISEIVKNDLTGKLIKAGDE
ncbi:glycosyltransferase, partial [Fulvivirga lutimaris]|uniref:glycosyltransferase n=1 Tax=Fulvivirga lutimaris TaxID=1819566 RepID=UPI0012BB9940